MNREQRRHPEMAGQIIRKRSEYVCPKCGNRPYLTDSGDPEALVVQRDNGQGRRGLHCADCFAVWQEAMHTLMPFQVPELVFEPVDKAILSSLPQPRPLRAS